MPYSRRGATDASNYREVRGELAVLVNKQLAGMLRLHPNRFLSFEYDSDYQGADVSVGMPRRTSMRYLDTEVRPWIEGLVPDNDGVRERMAQERGLPDSSAFHLLSSYGFDCPGAVQVCPVARIEEAVSEQGSYEYATDSEIAARLRDAADASRSDWHGEHEHWSLGGAQGKIALALVDGRWHWCKGSHASTHILKPGVANMTDQALVEFVSMQLADAAGILVAKTEYRMFDNVPAIVVERYDRDVFEGSVYRIHQEDLCQALHYLPRDKYDPSPHEIMELLSGDAEFGSRVLFTEALFFNYLIGATDAHAKNYSILHLDSGFALAPLYDVASIFPYGKTRQAPRRAAMPIGRCKVFGSLKKSNVERYASANDLDVHATCRITEEMAHSVIKALAELPGRCAEIPDAERVINPLTRAVRANCEAVLINLEGGESKFVPHGMADIESGNLPYSAR